MQLEPDNFEIEYTTMWNFKERGSWCTHKGNYRGNFSPYVPRNIILKYSSKNDLILDQFCGSGTTLVEAKLLARNSIGVDINPDALSLTKNNLHFKTINPTTTSSLYLGSAGKLNCIDTSSIDLICTHPPYAGIIKYSSSIQHDLSRLSLDDFLCAMIDVAGEAYRVLKPGKICAFLIGDIRMDRKVFPLGFKLLAIFQESGFTLKEIIIKKQNNCNSMSYWKERIKKTDYYLLEHEYLFIMLKE